MDFKIKGEYIELSALLKACGIASTGGEAGAMIQDGLVKCNNEVEHRKRRKLRPGDCVEVMGQKLTLS